LYLRYAQVQLGASVAGEPAGSMALHALGKIYSQFGELDPEEAPLAGRQGFALQHAALLARADNHLAAHELGVMLAESGHYVEAEYMLRQVALREPNTVVFRNLARVQRKLGREDLAAASDRQAQAAAGVTAYANVRWVPPQALAQTADAVPPDPTRIAAGPPRPHSAAPMPGGRVQPTYVR
jgi:Flp pilus assembly protein TadD